MSLSLSLSDLGTCVSDQARISIARTQTDRCCMRKGESEKKERRQETAIIMIITMMMMMMMVIMATTMTKKGTLLFTHCSLQGSTKTAHTDTAVVVRVRGASKWEEQRKKKGNTLSPCLSLLSPFKHTLTLTHTHTHSHPGSDSLPGSFLV